MLGLPPAPRAGHTASSFGRHTMLVYGGRGEAGVLDELWALQMYRSKPAAGQRAQDSRGLRCRHVNVHVRVPAIASRVVE